MPRSTIRVVRSTFSTFCIYSHLQSVNLSAFGIHYFRV
nr:MAG TPA: hypothetical protein [Caudoviricetes sp.]